MEGGNEIADVLENPKISPHWKAAKTRRGFIYHTGGSVVRSRGAGTQGSLELLKLPSRIVP